MSKPVYEGLNFYEITKIMVEGTRREIQQNNTVGPGGHSRRYSNNLCHSEFTIDAEDIDINQLPALVFRPQGGIWDNNMSCYKRAQNMVVECWARGCDEIEAFWNCQALIDDFKAWFQENKLFKKNATDIYGYNSGIKINADNLPRVYEPDGMGNVRVVIDLQIVLEWEEGAWKGTAA